MTQTRRPKTTLPKEKVMCFMGQLCLAWWQVALMGIAIVYLGAAFFLFLLLLIAAKGKIGKEDSFLGYVKLIFHILALPAAFIIGEGCRQIRKLRKP